VLAEDTSLEGKTVAGALVNVDGIGACCGRDKCMAAIQCQDRSWRCSDPSTLFLTCIAAANDLANDCALLALVLVLPLLLLLALVLVLLLLLLLLLRRWRPTA
jgi:hypothetical protein